MQYDADGSERVVCYQSLQQKPDELNYPVRDKEILAIKYALAMFSKYHHGYRSLAGHT